MTRIVEQNDWVSDPYLSKITTHHDFDGWYSYFTIKAPTPEDIELAQVVDIQHSQDDLAWTSAGFEDSVTFIDFVSFAWDRSFVSEGEEPEKFKWRAVFKTSLDS
jgi:hypothetical protein